MATQHHPRVPYTPWSKPRSCWTAGGNAKRRYATRSEARKIAKLLSRQEGSHMEAYWCPVCGGGCWHIGHVGHERQAAP